MKKIRELPLLILILLSTLFLGAAGLAGSEDAYLDYRRNTGESNPVSWVFLGLRDGILPWDVLADEAAKIFSAPVTDAGDGQPVFHDESGGDASGDESSGAAAGGAPEEDAQTPEPEGGTEGAESGEGGPDGEAEEILPTEPVMKTYSFVTVDESYFDDALFIGDSRTVGLWEYAGIEERAEFFCKTSLTIWDILEKPFIKTEEGRNVTVEEALQENKYGKIYLMVGINELGRGNTELFMQEYSRVVERIRQLQPDAVLFVEGIMRVSAQKNQTDPIFNNSNINERNDQIALLADQSNIFYIDVNEAVCDENGDLVTEYTFDQIHLKAAYYELWKQFLLQHGIVRD